jgi:hypothetical protein
MEFCNSTLGRMISLPLASTERLKNIIAEPDLAGFPVISRLSPTVNVVLSQPALLKCSLPSNSTVQIFWHAAVIYGFYAHHGVGIYHSELRAGDGDQSFAIKYSEEGMMCLSRAR